MFVDCGNCSFDYWKLLYLYYHHIHVCIVLPSSGVNQKWVVGHSWLSRQNRFLLPHYFKLSQTIVYSRRFAAIHEWWWILKRKTARSSSRKTLKLVKGCTIWSEGVQGKGKHHTFRHGSREVHRCHDTWRLRVLQGQTPRDFGTANEPRRRDSRTPWRQWIWRGPTEMWRIHRIR